MAATANGAHAGTRYRADVDGLRAIAILAVVGYHVGLPGFSGGFVGVDVFFVISGYLITGLLFEEAARTGRVDIAAFYARRVRRLLPALFVVVTAILLLSLVLLTPVGEQQALARQAIATGLFFANIHFWQQGGAYFEGPSDLKTLLNMWTLAVEEQFYIVWPLLVLGLVLAGRWLGDFRRLCLAALAVVFAVSLLAGWHATRTMPTAAFFLTPMRAWEFAIGGLLAVAIRDRGLPEHIGALAGVLGGAAILAAVVLFNDATPFPGLAALLPTLGAAAAIAGGAVERTGAVSRLLASRAFVGIGLLSYSWYLWHWPLLSLTRAYALGERHLPRDAAIALVALALAALTYRFVENPIRYRRPFPFDRVCNALAAGLALIVLMVLPAGALGWWAKTALATREPYRQFAFASKCNQDLYDDAALKPYGQCLYGDPAAKKLLVLWGDSHGEHMLPYLDAFGKKHGIAVLQRTRYQCPPLAGRLPVFRSNQRRLATLCLQFNRAVLQEIAALKDRDVGVFVSVRWPYYQNNGFVTDPDASIYQDYENGDSAHTKSLQAGVENLLAALKPAVSKVLFIGPLPQWKYNIPHCALRYGDSGCGLARAEHDRHAGPSAEVLKAVTRNAANARMWDATDTFCGRERCEPGRAGAILFRDHDHLSAKGAEVVGAGLEPDLLWLFAK